MGKIKGKSVLLFPYCTLERLPRAVFAQVCCIYRISARLSKYSTLGNRKVTVNRLFTSSALSFASITVAELKTRYMHYTESKAKARCHNQPYSCIPLLPSLPFAAINNWFRRNFHVSRLFFQLAARDYSKLYYHSLRLPDYHCTLQMRLHNKLYLATPILHQYNKPVKAPLREW